MESTLAIENAELKAQLASAQAEIARLSAALHPPQLPPGKERILPPTLSPGLLASVQDGCASVVERQLRARVQELQG